MTHANTRAPRRSAIPAAVLAAVLLAGCSSGHVGESWQCPLAEGGTCDSVAAADPAVPDTDAARKSVLTEPLYRVRGRERTGTLAQAPCEADCGGFDPFGWLLRLFGADPGSGAGARDEGDLQSAGATPQTSGPAAAPDSRTVAATPAPANHAIAPSTATSPSVAGHEAHSGPAEPATAALPAEPGAVNEDPAGDDLRTEEAVARIWIAPFVDADGVYREASHVRVVLEPAGWRVP